MKYSLFFAATAAASYDAYGGYQAQSSSNPSKPSSSAPAYNYGGYASQSSSVPSKSSSSIYGYGGYPSSSVKSSNSTAKATPCSTVSGSNGYATIVPGYGKPPVTITSQYQSYPTCVAMAYDSKSCDKWGNDKYVSTVITDYNKKTVTITKVQDYVIVYQEKKTITHYAPASSAATGGYAKPTGYPIAKNSTVWYELYEKIVLCKYDECGKNVLGGWTGSGLCQKCDTEQPVTQKEYKGGKWTEEKKTLNYGKPKDEVKTYEKPGVYTVPVKTVTVYSAPSDKPSCGSCSSNVCTYPPKVITITVPNQPYTCTYEHPKQTPSKTPSKGDNKPVTVTKTPSYNDYGYKASPTPTPKKPDYGYPSYPVKSNSTSSAYKPSTSPCDETTKSTATSSMSKPVYGDYNGPSSTPSKPTSTPGGYYGASSTPSKPTSTPAVYYGASSTPSMPSYTPPAVYYGASSSAPSKPSSTPCTDDKTKPSSTPYNNGYEAPKPSSTPYNNGYEAPKPTPIPASYEAPKPSPTPVYDNGGDGEYKPTPTPAQPAYPADPSGGYGTSTEYGKTDTGYTKRGGMIERRKAAVEAVKAKRAIVL